MPIIKRQAGAGSNPLKRSFVERIKTGNIVPVLSAEVLTDIVLRGRAPLVAGYADYIAYPLPDRDNLLKMARFKSIHDDLDNWALKSDYLNYVKNYIYDLSQARGVDEDLLDEVAEEVDGISASEFANRLGIPSFARAPQDPLLILADLPLPIYLTTGYHGFIEQALRRVGKTPRADFCRWHPGLDHIPSTFDDGYWPSRAEPLVYHLHGLDTRPDSLVLTEDDYLAFLVAISQDRGQATDPIPACVRQAMSGSALVMLGFDLASWAFRVFFWGLIKPATMTHKGVCCLQLVPSEIEKQYLQDYLRREAQFDVFWGDIYQYTQELRRMWRR
jgi:hypothetical protein